MQYARLLSLAFCIGNVAANSVHAALSHILPENQIMDGSNGFEVQERDIEARGGISGCTNSPTSRNCWTPGYTVADDFDKTWPTTGVTRYVCRCSEISQYANADIVKVHIDLVQRYLQS